MTKDEKRMLYLRAIAFLGTKTQISKFQEECLEAALAVARYEEDRLGARTSLLEEIVDVQIMVEQMSVIFDSLLLDNLREQKLARLKERLDALQG